MNHGHEPLASRLRPKKLADFVGQAHLLGPECVLSKMVQSGRLYSMILWGPPGVGKTTLAHLLAQEISADFKVLSAVNSGVKEIREIAEKINQENNLKHTQDFFKNKKQTVLFIDEIHRFSKSQQDALLPLVESGLVTLIGATTENPSFELNKALLSRARVHVLKALSDQDLLKILDRALLDQDQGYGNFLIHFDLDNKFKLIKLARQDARALLNLLELVIELSTPPPLCRDEHKVRPSTDLGERREIQIDIDQLAKHLGENIVFFDKQGDVFYDAISALHKSIRGSDPDASLYWLAKLLVGGVDGLYIARRLIRIASEDIGNADPRALQICINTWDVLERLGPGEGELALSQAVLFLSCAPKSNAGYLAFNQAMDLVKNCGSAEIEIPMHLRNSPTKLMTELGYGKNYRYPHDEPHGYAAGETYFPEGISYQFYKPSDRGLEKQIQERLKFLRGL